MREPGWSGLGGGRQGHHLFLNKPKWRVGSEVIWPGSRPTLIDPAFEGEMGEGGDCIKRIQFLLDLYTHQRVLLNPCALVCILFHTNMPKNGSFYLFFVGYVTIIVRPE